MPKKTKVLKKKYKPNDKEKYMCVKHKKFFTDELIKWRRDIIKTNNVGNIFSHSNKFISRGKRT